MKKENFLSEVKKQYEDYPYPPRDPEKDKTELICTNMHALDCINYYCFSGKRDFSSGIRVLVAGGGTGDATLFLAGELQDTNSEIVYVDLSAASMDVAQQRAKNRGLDNITWINASLLDLPEMDIGKFDYIACSGVLHHLESPESGLKALESVLSEDGVMAIMLYAKFGRVGVYHIQELMRILNKNITDAQQKVDRCKSVINNLPISNWFSMYSSDYGDIHGGDAGIYDLFLHSQDIAYSVADVYRFVESSNLNLLSFFGYCLKKGNDMYKLESYINDQMLLDKVKELPLHKKQEAAELLHSRINRHNFYISRRDPVIPDINDLDYIPVLSMLLNPRSYSDLHKVVQSVRVGDSVKFEVNNISVCFIKTSNAELLWKYIDGTRCLRQIYTRVRHNYKGSKNTPNFKQLGIEFGNMFDVLNKYNLMFLLDKTALNYRVNAQDMQARVDMMYARKTA